MTCPATHSLGLRLLQKWYKWLRKRNTSENPPGLLMYGGICSIKITLFYIQSYIGNDNCVVSSQWYHKYRAYLCWAVDLLTATSEITTIFFCGNIAIYIDVIIITCSKGSLTFIAKNGSWYNKKQVHGIIRKIMSPHYAAFYDYDTAYKMLNDVMGAFFVTPMDFQNSCKFILRLRCVGAHNKFICITVSIFHEGSSM